MIILSCIKVNFYKRYFLANIWIIAEAGNHSRYDKELNCSAGSYDVVDQANI